MTDYDRALRRDLEKSQNLLTKKYTDHVGVIWVHSCCPSSVQVAAGSAEHFLSGKQTKTDSPGALGEFLWWCCRGDDQSAARDGSGQHF